MMKILRVTGDLYPAFVGGIALHTHELSKMQVDLGNEVMIYTSHWGSEPDFEERDGYTVQRFKGVKLFRFSLEPRLFVNLWSHVKDYDIVHAHSHVYCCTLFSAIIRKFKKYPLVITCHGLVSQTVPMWIQHVYHHLFGKFVFRAADCVLTYTEFERDQIVSFGVKPEKIKIIHNGIDVTKFPLDSTLQKKKQIIWVGKYVPGKGAKYIIEGFAAFSKLHPEYSLLMIGKGPEKEEMVQLIESLSVSDKISMIEFVENEKLQRIYQESAVFVSSSLAEGVPKVLLEAMVCGLPVISTDLPQLIDIVEDCGIIVPVKDSAAITSALEEMVSSPEKMQEYGKNSRQKVLENYDWCDTVLKTTELFEELSSSNSKK